jgi:hypothetical protein
MTSYSSNRIVLNVFSLNNNDAGQSEILLRPLYSLMTYSYLSSIRPTENIMSVAFTRARSFVKSLYVTIQLKTYHQNFCDNYSSGSPFQDILFSVNYVIGLIDMITVYRYRILLYVMILE